MFRKIGNRSSEFHPDENEVRTDGSYIYEEFLETQGTDVKMYTVGPDYGHAEARKSPTVDGKVERDSDGKEVRFPGTFAVLFRSHVSFSPSSVSNFELQRKGNRKADCHWIQAMDMWL